MTKASAERLAYLCESRGFRARIENRKPFGWLLVVTPREGITVEHLDVDEATRYVGSLLYRKADG